MAILKIALIFLFATVCFAEKNNNTREGRIFSLFSIVQFPNEACSSTSGTFTNGTCFTSGECSSKGGSAQGNCAAGFGVCCVFSVSATGSTVNQNCSYIVNPNYPSNYAPTTTPATVSYTISKCSDDVCRVRLDYDSFILNQPTTVATVQGQCDTERLTFKTTDRTTEPTVGATGAYGDYPSLCGTNTGYHSYLDLSCTSTDTATLTFTLADATLNQWKIKVTQLSCGDSCVASQQGCFQYHTGTTGTIQSYNLAGGNQIATQNYKNCIRQEAGYCCVEFIVNTWTLDPTPDCAALATKCTGALLCSDDYVLIPDVENDGSNLAAMTTFDRFCGAFLSPTGVSVVNSPVTTCKCPFEVTHTTGITGLNGGAASVETGFSLDYRQLAGNC